MATIFRLHMIAKGIFKPPKKKKVKFERVNKNQELNWHD